MSLAALIAEIADQADDLLGPVLDREQARAALAELIERDYFELTPADRLTVTAGVMAALEEEERFGMEFVGDPFKDDPSSAGESDR
jgi:hypothetical protein